MGVFEIRTKKKAAESRWKRQPFEKNLIVI
jgi:hypothetical protein